MISGSNRNSEGFAVVDRLALDLASSLPDELTTQK